MHSILTLEFIHAAVKQNAWNFGNEILYRMCREHPTHKEPDVVIGNIWLIGRAYSAAIERRLVVQSDGDTFYEKDVAEGMLASSIDDWFAELKTNDSKVATLETHRKLTERFEKISGLEKRSLASKYLHFHFPKRFFFFDSRAQKALSMLIGRRKGSGTPTKGDPTYARFFSGCEELIKQIHENHSSALTLDLNPRNLDNVLLAVSRELPKK